MPGKSYLIAIILLALAFLVTMPQETSAQKDRRNRSRSAAVIPPPVAPDIAYKVSMPKPWTHLLEVEMRIKWTQFPDQTDIKMPVWTPGSYLVREFARHVQGFSVKSAAGNDLAWRKTSKNTWQVDTKGVGEVVVNYKVYSNELTVRTNELNDEHAFWNNAALLFFVKDQLQAPATVRVVPYGDWRVATGLPAVAGESNTFRAENVDALYDAPFEVSDFKEFKFTVLGRPHRYVISGEGNYDLAKLAGDTATIIDEAYKVFGEIPYDDYTFIINLRGRGGLEHSNSAALQTSRFGFKPDSRYKSFLNLVAHEFFHVWNVKNIRPDALGPFDYENENYTRLLWAAEGITAYYEAILLRRAGIITDRELLNDKALQIKRLQERPGRFETSLEEASFDAWIKYYRQDENAVNNQISYYDKGEIVSMMLDIAIRTASSGERSLDDVMRHLYIEYGRKGKNYTSEDLQKAAELAAGRSLDDFFSKYVRGRAEIDYGTIMQGIGLEVQLRKENEGGAYIGADLNQEGDRLIIKNVPADTPAYEQGLNASDQIVAVDGNRASLSFLTSYLGEREPNDKIKLTIFRYDRMRDITFTLGENVRVFYDLVPVPEPTEEQKRLYQEYMRADL